MTEKTPNDQPQPQGPSMGPAGKDDPMAQAAEQSMGGGMPEADQAVNAEPKPPSRVGRFARRALRWVTAVVVIFGLGAAAVWLVRVRPLQSELDDVRQQLVDSDNRLTQAEQRVSELEGVQQRNQALQDSLSEAQAHLDLLGVLVDVTSAQLAIAQEDNAAAKLTLSEVGPKLDALDSQAVVPAQQVQGLRDRLALAADEVDSDVFAAQRDLEILSNTILALERDVFGGGN